jgi:hypothetical protein
VDPSEQVRFIIRLVYIFGLISTQLAGDAEMEASLDLRRHFCSRTTALLVPLNRYLTTLIPSPVESASSASPATSNRPSRLKPFSTTNFLNSLKTHGSPLPFRSTSKQKEFYERWLKSPAFGLWLGRQEEIVQRVLQETAGRKVSTTPSIGPGRTDGQDKR